MAADKFYYNHQLVCFLDEQVLSDEFKHFSGNSSGVMESRDSKESFLLYAAITVSFDKGRMSRMRESPRTFCLTSL